MVCNAQSNAIYGGFQAYWIFKLIIIHIIIIRRKGPVWDFDPAHDCAEATSATPMINEFMQYRTVIIMALSFQFKLIFHDNRWTVTPFKKNDITRWSVDRLLLWLIIYSHTPISLIDRNLIDFLSFHGIVFWKDWQMKAGNTWTSGAINHQKGKKKTPVSCKLNRNSSCKGAYNYIYVNSNSK